ncbi:helix-turn-helix transcriptional regulator [Oscillatoria laete-virens NRMC-F 0139]|nr:helix-turn-helix transcriptional regulator [Oscillatoria laete-virens]MDL5053620.1 helix-turn-helix transcriptional regulator [Oscillatoria laete-virens NRMC-F 0139]
MNYFDDLTITYCGHSPRHAGRIKESWKQFALNYSHHGGMHFKYEDSLRHEAPAPLAWWVIPEKHYEFGNTGKYWDHHYVVFEGPRLRKWLRSGLFPLNQFPFIPIVDANEFKRKWDELLRIHQETLGRTTARSVLILEDILLQMFEEAQRPQQVAPARTNVRRVIRCMHLDPVKSSEWTKASGECGVSLAHFRKLFKAETGLSPVQYSLKSRLQQAAQMLVTTPLPVKMIAQKNGFNDIHYFSKLFKKYLGASPRGYRRKFIA